MNQLAIQKLDFWKKEVKDFSVLLLFPVFFILHGNNEFYDIIPWKTVLILFVKYCLVILFFWIVAVVFLKQRNKALVFAFYLICLFFLFGVFHDWIKSWLSIKFFTSYRFLLPAIGVLTVLIWIFLKRHKAEYAKPVRLIKLLLIVLTLIELCIAGYNFLSGASGKNNLLQDTVKLSSCSSAIKPDIFFIVFDGFTSSKTLKEEFDIDNKEVDSLFHSNNYFISAASESNYNSTPFSLSSTLGLSYLKHGIDSSLISSVEFIKGIETLKRVQLIDFLRGNDYKVLNFGCFNLRGTPSQIVPYFDYLYKDIIDNQTLYSRIKRDVGWSFQLRNIFTGEFRVPNDYKKNKALHLYRNQSNFNYLLSELNRESDTSRFVYAHLMLPHEPFFLDSLGKEIPDTTILKEQLKMKDGYKNQVIYANSLLKQIIPLAEKRSKRDKIIIIEGDHGFRDYPENTAREKIFSNLNVYYFSDHDYSMLYNGISPVNTFRVVLNKYFCQRLPMLKDSSIYLTEKRRY